MFTWITLAMGLAAAVFFTEYWLHGKHIRMIRAGISVAAGLTVYFILSMVWSQGAFLSAMAVGQIACLVYDFICCDRQLFLPELCLYFSGDVIWLPLCMPQSEDVWQYAVYSAALAFCMSLALAGGERERQYPLLKITEFCSEKMRTYWGISSLPCTMFIPAGFILSAGTGVSALSGLLLNAAFLLIYVLILWLQREMTQRLEAQYLNNAMYQWQQESRDYMNTIRSQRHDFNLHLHAVSGLINSGNYEQCQQYVQKLVSDAADVNDIMPVCDAVVGSMLYNMREEARRKGSDISYHITYDMENVLCNGFECNKIIGNLLQNAIDALQTPKEKEYGIRLSIFKRGGNTVIISENRFSGDPHSIARVFEAGYSTKKNHDGIGLSMVQRTVERYGGRIYPEFEEDRIRFIVHVPNKVRLQEGEEVI